MNECLDPSLSVTQGVVETGSNIYRSITQHVQYKDFHANSRWEKDGILVSVVTAVTLLLTFLNCSTESSNTGKILQGLTTLTLLPLLSSSSYGEIALCLFLTSISVFINKKLPYILPRCFTFGELFTTSQLLILISWRIIHTVLLTSETPSASSADIFCSVGVTGLLIATILSYLLNTSLHPIIFYIIYSALTVVFIVPVLYIYLQEFPLVWLIKFIFKSYSRVLLLCYWIGCSVLAGSIVGYYNTTREGCQISTIVRKYFHLVVVAVYIPGLAVDVEFLYLSSVVAMAFLIILETVRVCNIPPFGNLIDQSFDVFTDERDQGVIVLTHLYLLIGLSLPLWISESLSTGCNICLYSGVLSLGIGDTVASLAGSTIGRLKWPGTMKTVEGTVCSIVIQCLVVYISYYLGIFVIINQWNVLAAILLTSLLEAFTTQIDNLVLPIAMFALLSVSENP
ncbi:dolichol kinase [Patella vulgata]|uniref:dolichol kinase n=1 Tax=Patella vulgata TaxID=6465 RepID=UPI00217FD0CE|nr:dolichol kinase [Patella vulgata]